MATIDSLNTSISGLSFADAQAMIMASRNRRRVMKPYKKAKTVKVSTSKAKASPKSILAGMTAIDKSALIAMLEEMEI